MNLKKFARDFNRNFSPPFLPDGFANAKIMPNGSLSIRIGPRDWNITEDGKLLGAGTTVGSANKWVIKTTRRKDVSYKKKNPPHVGEKEIK